jgi:hypothetical protein
MTDSFEAIEEGCFFALRCGLSVSAVPTGNLLVLDGIYMFSKKGIYHPLETILHATVASGDWRADVRIVLGVEEEWISGYLDGFAQEPETSRDGEYVQGFLCAEMLRAKRYWRELPAR